MAASGNQCFFTWFDKAAPKIPLSGQGQIKTQLALDTCAVQDLSMSNFQGVQLQRCGASAAPSASVSIAVAPFSVDVEAVMLPCAVAVPKLGCGNTVKHCADAQNLDPLSKRLHCSMTPNLSFSVMCHRKRRWNPCSSRLQQLKLQR
mmetsp:Transcript_62407/g.120234  ORF Transcript_62407/g.120234 Transcript_62407/m.120234 type:complete len:147 (-) Transcript_62407:312-752(-)